MIRNENNFLSIHNPEPHTRPKKYIPIPFNNQFFNSIKKSCFKSSTFSAIPIIKYQLSHVIKKGKDKIPYNKNTNIVYKINCSNCEAIYVGEAKRQLQIRLGEHERDVRKNNNNAIPTHCRENQHTMDWEKAEILDKESI